MKFLKGAKKCGDGWWHLGNCCINLQCIKQQFRLQDATSLKKGGHRRTMSPFKEKEKWACVCVLEGSVGETKKGRENEREIVYLQRNVEMKYLKITKIQFLSWWSN